MSSSYEKRNVSRKILKASHSSVLNNAVIPSTTTSKKSFFAKSLSQSVMNEGRVEISVEQTSWRVGSLQLHEQTSNYKTAEYVLQQYPHSSCLFHRNLNSDWVILRKKTFFWSCYRRNYGVVENAAMASFQNFPRRIPLFIRWWWNHKYAIGYNGLS